jgi:hypothetical protein
VVSRAAEGSRHEKLSFRVFFPNQQTTFVFTNEEDADGLLIGASLMMTGHN